MSTIFACTDLGPESDKVIMSAINLSKILNTNVRILFLDEVSPVYFGPDISLPYFPNYVEVKEWNAKISEPVLARIEQQLKRLQLTKAQLKIEIIDATGFKKFDSFLQTNDCSLLMIGASQKSGIERIMLGSFLEKAIFNLTVNLMVIKNLITAAPKNIALSIDIEHDDGLIVGQACRLAKLFNTGVNLLHFVN
jgi:nucleotide-binding universal stress UspA family protein